jgi:hypothetical protein
VPVPFVPDATYDGMAMGDGEAWRLRPMPPRNLAALSALSGAMIQAEVAVRLSCFERKRLYRADNLSPIETSLLNFDRASAAATAA